MLKFAWTATLFTVGLVHTGSWHKAVLDTWSVNCTLWPHPAPYPRELRRLANGEATWHGVKQVFTCAPDPEWEAFVKQLRAMKTDSEHSATNRNAEDNGPVPKLLVGGR